MTFSFANHFTRREGPSLRTHKTQMALSLYDTNIAENSVLCCYTDTTGAHWCLKEIKNIKPGGFSNVFICSGQRCNFKLYFSTQTDFCVKGIHRCAFDHEGEYRRRVCKQLALDAIKENVTLRPRDIVNLVACKTTMTERERRRCTGLSLSPFKKLREVPANDCGHRHTRRTQTYHRHARGHRR